MLHVRSELAYTSNPLRALPDEPEAVPADYQRELVMRADRVARCRRRDQWVGIRTVLADGLDRLRLAPFAGDCDAEVRMLEQGLSRLERKLS